MGLMKLRNSVRRPALVLVLVVLLPMMVLTTACDESQFKKAKVASKTIANLVNTALQMVPSLREQGLIDEGDAETATKGLSALKFAVDEFNQRAASYKSFDPKARADLARAFTDVTAALAVLNAEGVLHIKDPQLRGRVQIGLTTLNLAAQQIELALQPE